MAFQIRKFKFFGSVFYRFYYLLFPKSKGKKEIELKKERKKERKIPEFPKPLAPALRFGSMNPISRILGRSSTGERHRDAKCNLDP